MFVTEPGPEVGAPCRRRRLTVALKAPPAIAGESCRRDKLIAVPVSLRPVSLRDSGRDVTDCDPVVIDVAAFQYRGAVVEDADGHRVNSGEPHSPGLPT